MKNKKTIRVIRAYKFRVLTKQFLADIEFITGGFRG